MSESFAEHDPGDLIAVGKINKVHGIKGEVKVRPYFGSPDDFLNYRKMYFRDPESGLPQHLKVSRCRPQAGDVILKLEGLDDRTAAEGYRGVEILVDKKLLPPLPEDEYYWHELVGFQVETDIGRHLGKVATFFQTAGHDVMVVRGSGREYLIPLEKEFILKRDGDASILTVKDLPGLFAIND
ncbi:MAG: ribosome maturation factor RimM [Thermodesulfobacteriota bacterium]